MLQPLDEDSENFYLTEELIIPAPKVSSNLLEGLGGDDTDELIDQIDLENDDDVINLLGVLLDG